MSTIYRARARNAVLNHRGGERPMPAQRQMKTPDPDTTLRSIMEGTAGASGEHFYRSLVQYLAVSLNVKASFVAEFNPDRSKVLTLAVWVGDQHVPNFEFEIEGTPCKQILSGQSSTFPTIFSGPFPPTLCSRSWMLEVIWQFR